MGKTSTLYKVLEKFIILASWFLQQRVTFLTGCHGNGFTIHLYIFPYRKWLESPLVVGINQIEAQQVLLSCTRKWQDWKPTVYILFSTIYIQGDSRVKRDMTGSRGLSWGRLGIFEKFQILGDVLKACSWNGASG